MVNLEKLDVARLEWKHAREHRDALWKTADAHLKMAVDAAGQVVGAKDSLKLHRDGRFAISEERVRHLEIEAQEMRTIAICHLRLAKQYFKDAGVDVSGVEIPSE